MLLIRNHSSHLSFIIFFLIFIIPIEDYSQGFEGYYRYSAAHNNTVVFMSEGDLWSVPLSGGLARAPMFGVYGPNEDWLIEGHGFEPDIEIENLPHQTFNAKDVQVEAAIEHLQKLIKEDPREVPPIPTHPDKSFKKNY